MKRLLLINPNTSPGVTAGLEAAARPVLASGWELVGVTASLGFPVIASRASYAIAAHAALEAFASAPGPFDAIVVGCFGDPGIEALREVSGLPVAGLAEAAIRQAVRAEGPFAILTMGTAWREMLGERVALAGAAPRLVGVIALEGTGLDAVAAREATLARLGAAARQAVAAGARTIIPGGATLAGLASRLPEGPRYIDCVVAAVGEACGSEATVAAGPPLRAPTIGLSPALAGLLAPAATGTRPPQAPVSPG